MSFYPECDGTYECESDGHVPGCLSHTIDPPSEIHLVARTDDLGDATVRRVLARGGRIYRDDSE